MDVTVTQLKPDIGVEITGITGPAFVDPEVAARANALLDAHGVLIYKGADIGDDDLFAFAHLLGPVHEYDRGADAEYPQLAVVSLDPEMSSAAPVQHGTFQWHVDGTMDEHPHRVTLLTCLVPAADGSGDTEFANTCAAYEALTEDVRAQLDGLQVRYSYLNRARLQTLELTPEARQIWSRRPPRERPLLWAYPSGRTSMLLGAQAGEILGWPLDEGEAMLARLLKWSTQPRFTLRHHWDAGDLVLWDNAGVLHRAHPYTRESGRLMHRTTVDYERAAA
jgi:alpha-ketoglutarate-dependent taurine dioxygenase